MDKLKLTRPNLGRVFNSRSGCLGTMKLLCSVAVRPNLELKTRPKQLLGSLPLESLPPPPYPTTMSARDLFAKRLPSKRVKEESNGTKSSHVCQGSVLYYAIVYDQSSRTTFIKLLKFLLKSFRKSFV